jgi:CHAD domain-containing protein
LPKAASHVPVPGWLDLLREAAEVKRGAAHRAVWDEQQGAAFTNLLLGIQGWVEDGVVTPTVLGDRAMGRPMADLAPALLDRVARKVAKRGRGLQSASHEELHALRKSAKKLRYAVEFLSSAYPRKAIKAYVGACKDVQTLLGKSNDAAVTPVLAARLAEGGHADLAPAIGTLVEWSVGRRKKALRDLPKAWNAFRAAERFWE